MQRFRKYSEMSGFQEKQHRSKTVQLPAVKEEKGLASVAREHFDRAMNAQREGNWALYGEEIKKLGEIIRKMQK